MIRQPTLQVVNLKCEYQSNPLGIDVTEPRFSWVSIAVDPGARAKRQSAYQILVAADENHLSAERGNVWDSGRVDSDQSVLVVYSGKPLESHIRYSWKVRVWDEKGIISSWSDPASWQMGLLRPGDWQGDWVGAIERSRRPTPEPSNGYHSLETDQENEIKWVQIDLGKKLPLDRIVLHPALPMNLPNGRVIRWKPGYGFPVRFRIDIASDAAFRTPTTIADLSREDYENPAYRIVAFPLNQLPAQYIRMTAMQLWKREGAEKAFHFALGELEVFSNQENVALNKPVTARDSVEGFGWSKDYLTDGRNRIRDLQAEHPALMIRKTIGLEKQISQATAYISGLGYCELYINGEKVGDHVLDPGYSDYTKRVLYVTHDVTSLLKRGSNAIGVLLGNGWFNLPTLDLWGYHAAPWIDSPRVLLNIRVEFTDGTHTTIFTDETWKYAAAPITYNCVYGGETHDARKEVAGWEQAAFDDHGWQPVKEVTPPKGALVAQHHPPIRVTGSIRPIALHEPKPGIYLFDLGVNMSGWVQFKTSGKPGQKITLKFDEHLNPDGTLNQESNRIHFWGRYQTDEYILKGKGIEIFEPRFTYHGFRYVQVEGMTEKPGLESLTGRLVHTDVKPAGSFSCSNELLNTVQEMILRTQKNNLHGIPTDCPHREKLGWMADGCITMEEAMFNFDMATFYRKWFQDMLDAREPDGHVPPIVPNCGWIEGTTGRRTDGSPPAFSDPWWGGAVVLTPWKLYLYYGDRHILEQGYETMKGYIDYLSHIANHYIVDAGLGDWVDIHAFAVGPGKITPFPLMATAAYFWYTRILSKTAAILHKSKDSQKYRKLADKIRDRFNETFLNSGKRYYAHPNSQASQALALYLKIVPEAHRQQIVDHFLANISTTNNSHLNTGIIATLYLFYLLTDIGHGELAYMMATQRDFPGWGHMVERGATTIWETWHGPETHSRNHPAFGSIEAWFFRSLAGIQPDVKSPGFKKIIIKPEIVGDLTWAKANYQSVHGTVVSDWRLKNGDLVLRVIIPVNTSATVYIPTEKSDKILESDMPLSRAEGVSFLGVEKKRTVLQVGSGQFTFRVPWKG